MLDILLKNKQLTALALVAGAFYAYTKIMENQKLRLEIELLQRELDGTHANVNGKKYVNRFVDNSYKLYLQTGAQVI